MDEDDIFQMDDIGVKKPAAAVGKGSEATVSNVEKSDSDSERGTDDEVIPSSSYENEKFSYDSSKPENISKSTEGAAVDLANTLIREGIKFEAQLEETRSLSWQRRQKQQAAHSIDGKKGTLILG